MFRPIFLRGFAPVSGRDSSVRETPIIRAGHKVPSGPDGGGLPGVLREERCRMCGALDSRSFSAIIFQRK